MSTNVRCPECQTQLSVSENVITRTVVCPRCFNEIDNPRPAPTGEAPNLLRDVRRDSNTVGWVLGVLIALCVARISLTFVVSFPPKLGGSGWAVNLIMLCFFVLDILVFAAGVRRLWLLDKWKSSLVSVLGFVLLTILLGMAIVVFFTAICANMVLRLIP